MNRLSSLLIILALVLGVLGIGLYDMTDPRPKRVDDGLQSAKGQDLPVVPCAGQAPEGAFTLTLGNAALWFRDFPHAVVTVNGQPQFTIDRSKSGTIAVDLRIFAGGRELGHLHGVTLQDAGSSKLKLTRPSGSTVLILTEEGAPVLQIDYINDKSLRITGHLAFGDHDFIMLPDGFMQDSRNLGATCLGGDKKVDFAF